MYIIYAVNKIGCQPYKKEFCGCFVGPGKSQHNLRFLLSWLFFPICWLFSIKIYLFSLKKDNSSNNNHTSRVLLLMVTCNFMKINLGLLLRAVCRDCFREVHCCQSCLRTISSVRPCVCLTVTPLQICVRRTYIVLWMLLVLFLVYFDGIIHFLGNVDLVFVYILQFQLLLLFFLYISLGPHSW